MLQVLLAAKRGNWQRFIARRRNERFLAIQPKLLKRDEYTCRYCGFFSHKFQVVVNHDHNYSNNTANNMVTACLFCAQCFFLESVGKNANVGGYVIYLPEISQADLNNFCRAMFCAMLTDASYSGKLQAVYLSLQERGKIVEEIFGPDATKPAVMGQAIIDSGLPLSAVHKGVFASLRLLPNYRSFMKQIEYWREHTFHNILN
jgi:intracellular multiplication protein IcmJ